MTRRLTAIVAALTTLLITLGAAACSAGGSSGKEATLEDQLLRRPRFEQAEADYLAMLTEIRTLIGHRIPAMHWEKPAPYRSEWGGGAAPYHRVTGAFKGYYDIGGTGSTPIPDAIFPSVLNDIQQIAARHGFTQTTTLANRPGNHDVAVHGQWGDTLHLGTELASSCYIVGGTFLTQNRTYPTDTNPSPTTTAPTSPNIWDGPTSTTGTP